MAEARSRFQIVNDSPVLIDFLNQERSRGTLALEAVRTGSRLRGARCSG